jgi:hypothetical protein
MHFQDVVIVHPRITSRSLATRFEIDEISRNILAVVLLATAWLRGAPALLTIGLSRKSQ